MDIETIDGHPVFAKGDDATGVLFIGRGPAASRREAARRVTGLDRPLAWLRQEHGCRVVEATAGDCGEGDALVTGRRDLVLAISTADCVPVVLSAGGRIAAVHAGWRGIVAGVVTGAARRLASAGATAWIGPAIGLCCYEVGPEVARQVAAAAGDEVVDSGGERPHLDLVAAVVLQLRAAGVRRTEIVEACTRCRDDLHSYRRDGDRAGRNLTLAWRREI